MGLLSAPFSARMRALRHSLNAQTIKAMVSLTVDFPCGSAGKESTRHAGDLGLIPGLGRSLGEGKGYPLQYPGLENSVDCIVHGATKSQT